MAPQLLPGDRRDWKAAGVLAYSVDETGVHLLLGKIDQRLSYSPPRAKELGWWILGTLKPGLPLSCKHMMQALGRLLAGSGILGCGRIQATLAALQNPLHGYTPLRTAVSKRQPALAFGHVHASACWSV